MKTIEELSTELLEMPTFNRKKACPNCDGTKFERKMELDDYGKNLVQIAQCKNCGEKIPIRPKKRNATTLGDPDKMQKILNGLLLGG